MKSKLKFTFLVFLIFFTTLFCFSQNTNEKKVKLIEKLNGKRLELYAKNTDTTTHVVFLRITTNDYRRSSNRPVLKPVEPNSETHLLTLIKLAGSEGTYEHQFIVNEVSNNLKFRKDDDDMQINFDSALKTAKIIIYSSDNCEFCDDTKTLFNKNRIAFIDKYIEKDKTALIKLLKKYRKSTENLNNESLIIQIESEIYRGIKDKKELLEVLKNYIE